MADVSILPDERVDTLQLGQLRILQKTSGFRFGMDAVLLADFATVRPRDTVADFGTGTGILPLLLIGRGKGQVFHAFEIQQDMADMATRTMQLNDVADRVTVWHQPVAEAHQSLSLGSVDCVICNPPYGPAGRTMRNPSDALSIARHLDEEGLLPWFQAGFKVLRDHGRFAMVYPATYLFEALSLLRAARLEPKRFRLVYPSAEKAPNLALIEAVKNGRPPLQPLPPLIVHEADGRDTAELRRIYHMEEEA